jgi:hypothetical protein
MKQFHAAASGVQSVVDKLITETSMKDRIALTWISQLVEKSNAQQRDCIECEATKDSHLNVPMSKKQQKALKDTIKAEIQQDLLCWLIMQPPDHFDQLSDNSCE